MVTRRIAGPPPRRTVPSNTHRIRAMTLATCLLVVGAAALAAHDLFFKLERYFVEPHSLVRIHVLNGTFDASEAAVMSGRLRDLSLAGPAGTTTLDTAAWQSSGDTSVLTVRTGGEGTYAVGASLRPRELRLEAREFNAYLAEDGLPDVLEERRRTGRLDQAARERYSKHVKALLQVGAARSGQFATQFGYPAELVALDNPYATRPGETFRVRALVDGQPVVNQVVIFGGRTPRGSRIAEQQVRTDSAGVAAIRLEPRGRWYVKFIRMTETHRDTTIDYESKWATLTFQLR